MNRVQLVWLFLALSVIGAASYLGGGRAAQSQAEADTAYKPPRPSPADGPADPAASSSPGKSVGLSSASVGEGLTETKQDAGNRRSSWDEVLVVANEILESMRKDLRDYEGTLVSRERVKGKLQEESRMHIKVRNASAKEGHGLSAYLKFSSKHNKGREVIWSEDATDGKMLVHEGGLKKMLLGTLSLDPDGMLAMNGQKYPITEIGLIRLTEKIIEKGQSQRANKQAVVQIIENQKVGNRTCRLYQVTNSRKSALADFYIAQVYVDTERKIPLRFVSYMWPEQGGAPPLEEEYTYLDLKLNVGLDAADFDPENEAYDFP